MITGLLNLQITPDMLFLHADTDKFLTMTEYKSEKIRQGNNHFRCLFCLVTLNQPHNRIQCVV